MNNPRMRKISDWGLSVLLAIAFAMAAVGKLTGAATGMFAGWGYATWFAMVIGGLEALGAVGLLIPRTRSLATLGLSGIMVGAMYTHLTNSEGGQVVRPLIFLIVLGIVWWLRRTAKRNPATSRSRGPDHQPVG